LILVLAAAVVASACVSKPAESGARHKAKNRCFDVNQVRDRFVLDERRMLIWTRTTPYLILLGRPIPELTQGHNSISLIDGNHDGEICENLKDGVYLEDTLMPKATNIVRLIQLNDAQVKSLEHTYKKPLQRRPRGLWKRKQPESPDEATSR
jgi:hypothetical protein